MEIVYNGSCEGHPPCPTNPMERSMDDQFPPRTHEPLDLDEIWDLSDALADRLEEGGDEVTFALLEEVARAQDSDLTHLYVAAGLDPDTVWKREYPVAFVVCTGSCQAWGSIEALEGLITERSSRVSAGRPAFDIVTTACLDVCLPSPPYAVSLGPEGKAVHPGVTRQQVMEAVATRVDGE